jgi:hypothetical protein
MNDLWEYNPGNSQWTWVAGTSVPDIPGTYGTKGVGSTSNIPTGRAASASWTDSSGSLWLFGGQYLASNVNDLWEFNPSNSQWTWVAGASTANQNGTYGTEGTGSTSNIPGARGGVASWVDSSGNVWLFGGSGLPASGSTVGSLNDLWKYAPGTSAWTWVTGVSTINPTGTYGTQGVASSTNTPGGRGGACAWKDSSGNFWLFGGVGYGSSGGDGYLNDLWKFSPGTTQWTWVSGSKVANNSTSSYGNSGIPVSSNLPPVRSSAACWQDSSGSFWMMGGTNAAGELGDLWMFSPGKSIWTWVGGAATYNATAVYGTEGVSSSSNFPGSRDSSPSGILSSGTLWLFGGSNANGLCNDLWRAQ